MPGGRLVSARPRHGSDGSAPGARRRALGVGLIEILVTILLLSIGFLAAARMQVQGMRISQDAYNRSQAYFLAADMIDRMRSNVGGVLDGHYDGVKTSAEASDKGCGAKACSPREAAEQDLHEWSAQLHAFDGQDAFVAALPGTETNPAYGEITKVAGEDGLYTVELGWVETIGGEDKPRTLTMNFATEIEQ